MTELDLGETRSLAPQPLDVVSGSDFSDIVAAAQRRLEQLTRDCAAATTAADAAEEAERARQANSAAATWTIVRLQRFLLGLRADAERDAAAMITAAHMHAQLRGQGLSGSGEPASSAIELRPPFAASVTDVAQLPVMPSEAEVEQELVPLPPDPAPLAAPVVTAPEVRAPEVPPAPIVPPAPVAPPTFERGADDVPRAAATAGKKPRGRILPLSVILEVLAVVLLLVFIVLRLS